MAWMLDVLASVRNPSAAEVGGGAGMLLVLGLLFLGERWDFFEDVAAWLVYALVALTLGYVVYAFGVSVAAG